MTSLQPLEDLERHYAVADPWAYQGNPHDARRRSELLSLLPNRRFKRVLDIGCGDGFITFALPGDEIVGADVSAGAIRWARAAAEPREDRSRFRFEEVSIFDLPERDLGTFDLVIITGVLYPQYIGRGSALVRLIVDDLLRPAACLVSCHIDEWTSPRFPYEVIDVVKYPYREYTHRLEVMTK